LKGLFKLGDSEWVDCWRIGYFSTLVGGGVPFCN